MAGKQGREGGRVGWPGLAQVLRGFLSASASGICPLAVPSFGFVAV